MKMDNIISQLLEGDSQIEQAIDTILNEEDDLFSNPVKGDNRWDPEYSSVERGGFVVSLDASVLRWTSTTIDNFDYHLEEIGYSDPDDYEWNIARGDDLPNAITFKNRKMIIDPEVYDLLSEIEGPNVYNEATNTLFQNPVSFDDAWLDDHTKSWTRRSDGKIDVEGDVSISGLQLDEIPYDFGTLNGSFNCTANKLVSLKGAPEVVTGTFNCSGNGLTSLEGGPKEVGGEYSCVANQLINLEGAPKEAKQHFNCGRNSMHSLKGSPEKIGSDFSCGRNDFETLKGGPKWVGRDFICFDTPLKSLEGAPEEIEGVFHTRVFSDKSYRAFVKERDG